MRKISEKIDSITGMLEKHRSNRPPCPKACKIELTGRCNFACSFCATSKNMREKGDMDWEFYCRLLRDYKESGGEEVGLFYLGESFILPWLAKAVEEAKRAGFSYVFLTTNGVSATKSKVADCMAAGLNSLKFSLNYADPEQFSIITGMNENLFQRIIDNIKAARIIRDKKGYDCGLYASYIDYDAEQGRKMQELVRALTPYLDEIYALPLYSQADLTGKNNQSNGWTVRGGNPGRVGNLRDPVPCWSLFTEARVSWDGRLSMCCFDHDERFNAGSIDELSFMGAWHSAIFRKLRDAHLSGDVRGTACEGCISFS
ncbi:MAG: radical SAM protein [Magnetococcus sp. YQC-3]